MNEEFTKHLKLIAVILLIGALNSFGGNAKDSFIGNYTAQHTDFTGQFSKYRLGYDKVFLPDYSINYIY